MKMIAAVDNNWGLGCYGELLFCIPADMKRFRAITTGGAVIMGRKTWESLPNGPLPNRDNIVLTREPGILLEGAWTCCSLESLWKLLREPQFTGKQVFVIGGAQIYELLLPYCEEALITHVRTCRQADCFFPKILQTGDWVLNDMMPWEEYNGLAYAFASYINQNTLAMG